MYTIKKESCEEDATVDVVMIKVEDVQCSHANTSMTQLNDVPFNIFDKASTLRTDQLKHPINIEIADYNKCVKKEIEGTNETNIKDKCFEYDEIESFQRNDNLHNVTEKTESVLDLQVSSIKSENVVCNTEDKKSYLCRFCEHKTENINSMIDHVQIHCGMRECDLVESEKLQPQETLFVCNDCGYLCSWKSNLITHIRCHTKKKEQVCPTRGYKTVKMGSFHKNVTIHNANTYTSTSNDLKHSDKSLGLQKIYKNKKSRSCKFCDYKTNNKYSLVLHIKRHSGKLPFVCNFCDYKCSKTSHLTRHKRTHTRERPFACDYCDHKSITRADSIIHMRIHTGEKPYTCDYCGYKSITKASLIYHMWKHTGEKPFACDYCDYKSITRAILTKHMWIHTDEKPFACDYCNHKSITKASLSIHMRIHTGEKPFACKQCDYKSISKKCLNRHIKKHTGKKLFACDYCDHKSFSRANLIIHVRIHTGEKPYACNQCDYRSISISGLNAHIKKHISEKPFTSDNCEFRTTNSSSLVGHIKKHMVAEPRKLVGPSVRSYSRKSVGEKLFACNYCDFRCLYASSLVHHKKIHTGENS